MRKDAGDLDLRDVQIIFDRVDEFVRLKAEAVEPGIDLQVRGRSHAMFACRVRERARVDRKSVV